VFHFEARFAALHARRPGFFRLHGLAAVPRRAAAGIPTSLVVPSAHETH
jgi:hypothetical protein